MRKITKKMIREGFDSSVIKIIDSPHDDGAVCSIGEHWFYFGGLTAEQESAESYLKNVPKEDIISEIYITLEDFRLEPETFGLEYDYYYYYLAEKPTNKMTILRGGTIMVREHQYTKERLLDIMTAYLTLIERDGGAHPTVVLDDIAKSIKYVLGNRYTKE